MVLTVAVPVLYKAASPVSPTVPGIQEDSRIILSSNTRERSQSCFDMKRLRHFFPAPVSLATKLTGSQCVLQEVSQYVARIL